MSPLDDSDKADVREELAALRAEYAAMGFDKRKGLGRGYDVWHAIRALERFEEEANS
jgi:hypothetical protein